MSSHNFCLVGPPKSTYLPTSNEEFIGFDTTFTRKTGGIQERQNKEESLRLTYTNLTRNRSRF